MLDIGLPDISGLEVARRLRKAGSAVPILMLTVRDAAADRVAGCWYAELRVAGIAAEA